MAHIVNSLYSGVDSVLALSSMMQGEYGISDVCLSVPCVLGKRGIITTLTPKLSEDEMENFISARIRLKALSKNSDLKHPPGNGGKSMSVSAFSSIPFGVILKNTEDGMEYRIEKDTMGEMRVPADKYWGAQTERSHENFLIGGEVMPREITRAFGYLKKAAANANCRLGVISEEKRAAIADACDKVISGELNEHFPLVVWQTGSGTQSNMNANEVIANYANAKAGKKLLHPNDDVNKSQSSNDTFPTAMHIAAVLAIEDKLLPAMDTLIATFKRLEAENEGIVKSGRTHLQDAVPIAFSQEISGWRNMLEKPVRRSCSRSADFPNSRSAVRRWVRG